jgi:PAS domain S-box-containing protein
MALRPRTRLQKRRSKAAAGSPKPGSARAFLNPIITMDEGGVIRSASDSVEQVFGWTPTELFGRNVKILIPQPRRSALDRYLDRYRNADTTKSLTRTRRFDAVRKNGTLFQIELSMSRAELPIDSAPFFIGIVRDVSREIEIGPESVDGRTRMHELIMEQTRALASAHLRLQLADRMAALGTLAAGLGHNLNNVLLPVRARLDAADHARSIRAARTHLKAIRLQIAYLQSMSDGLHALTLDPEGIGDSDIVTGSTHLAEWWKQVGPLLRNAVPKRVLLKARFSDTLPSVGIEPQWLTQALLNLIVNAGEAVPRGRAGVIHIWAKSQPGRRLVQVGITDNGIGMSREVQRRALDLFFTTKSRSMGTGLGLPLARKVAVRTGGELVLSSQLGKGTTVILELPVAPRSTRHAAGRGAAPRTAVVSVANERTAALIGQVLLGAGVHSKKLSQRGPGEADLWVTDPTQKAVEAAERWRTSRPAGAIAVVGPPSPRTQRRWSALGAVVLGSGDDVQAIRHALGQALALT